MNKAKLVDEVQNALGGDTSKRTANNVVEIVLAAITKGIHSDGKVQLIGFGSFHVAERPERIGRDPRHPERQFTIKASKTVRFVPSSALKSSL